MLYVRAWKYASFKMFLHYLEWTNEPPAAFMAEFVVWFPFGRMGAMTMGAVSRERSTQPVRTRKPIIGLSSITVEKEIECAPGHVRFGSS